MKIIDEGESLRFLLRAPLEGIISFALGNSEGFLWHVVSSDFHPVTGEVVKLEGPFKLSVSKLPPEQIFGEQSVPDDEFRSSIMFGEVPRKMWQQLPESGLPTPLVSGREYIVRARGWHNRERARFIKA